MVIPDDIQSKSYKNKRLNFDTVQNTTHAQHPTDQQISQ